MKGSLTVEASFLMIIMIPIMAGIIYLSFYLHGSAWLNNSAYEAVIYGSLNQWDEDEQVRMAQCRKLRLQDGLYGAEWISGKEDVDKKSFSASYCGVFAFPGMLFMKNEIRSEETAQLSAADPVGTILKMKNIKEIMKGDEE